MMIANLCFFLLASSIAAAAPSNTHSSEAPLRVLLPLRRGFTEFVRTFDNKSFHGLSVQVFQSAIAKLHSTPPNITYEGYGNRSKTPAYDGLIARLQKKEVDVVVGDVTITHERMEKVDFTQPYVQSALVVVIPARFSTRKSMWDFLRPFSWQLWVAIVTAFLGTGVVILMLEGESTAFEGSLYKRFLNVYWFICLTLFFAQRDRIQSQIGRLVIVTWLLVVLVFTSSYTANLSSILTSQRLSPKITGLESLIRMKDPVGYQQASFLRKYLTDMGINDSRLIRLDTEYDYANALKKGPKKGGVAAIVDELPYVTKFLASNCDFTTVGDQVTYSGGLGFALQKNSTLTEQLSMAIMAMAEDGELQALKDGWLGTDTCSLQTTEDHMTFPNFLGLFIILGGVYVLSLLWHAGKAASSSNLCVL